MAGFQFIHVETYGRVASKGAKRARWTIREVIAEAGREPGACAHVAEPRPPVLLHGQPPAEVERELLAEAEATRDAAGRRHRRDAQLLLAGVVSYPARLGNATDAERSAFAAWERDTLAWLRKTYGKRLRCVIRHEDEPFLHLHWFAVADLAAGERPDAIHPGRHAMAEAKVAGVESKAELDRLYREAMRRFQDDYHSAVGARQGLTRRGPGRRRLTRAEWHAERAAAEHTAGVMRRSDTVVEFAAELEHANTMLAIEVANEGLGRRIAERERNEWRDTAKSLSAELAASQEARARTEADLVAERRRGDELERLLAEARQRTAAVVEQATALMRSLLHPLRSALPRPEWLPRELWNRLSRIARPVRPPMPPSQRSINRDHER